MHGRRNDYLLKQNRKTLTMYQIAMCIQGNQWKAFVGNTDSYCAGHTSSSLDNCGTRMQTAGQSVRGRKVPCREKPLWGS